MEEDRQSREVADVDGDGQGMSVMTSAEAKKQARRERQRAYNREYMARPGVKERVYANKCRRQRERYAKDPAFRKKMKKYHKEWRRKNHEYDMLRKTIQMYEDCGNQKLLAKRRRQKKKRISNMTKSRWAEYRKKNTKAASAWYHCQMNDPELGQLYRLQNRKVTRFFTQEMRDAAREKYQDIMAKRKEQRRRQRVQSLMKGLTKWQKKKIQSRNDTSKMRGNK